MEVTRYDTSGDMEKSASISVIAEEGADDANVLQHQPSQHRNNSSTDREAAHTFTDKIDISTVTNHLYLLDQCCGF